jgi:hypothetical protein
MEISLMELNRVSNWRRISDCRSGKFAPLKGLSRSTRMTSAAHGNSTSGVEVTNVSAHGFWLLLGEEELFVSFEEFPWFKDASSEQITRIEAPSERHLYWPELDVDLAVESFRDSKKYPLISR